MNRRRALAGFVATIVVGLGVIAAGIATGERLNADTALNGALHTPVVWALLGVWAETRGIVPAGAWIRHPARTIAAIVARLEGSTR